MAQILETMVKMSMLMSGNVTAQVTPAVKSLDALSQKMRALQKQQKDVSAWQKQADKVKALEERIKSAKNESTKAALQERYESQKLKLDELTESLKKAGAYSADMAAKQAELAREMEKANAAQLRLSSAQERYSSIRQQLTFQSMKGDILASMGTLKAFQVPVKVSMDYEQAMAQVKAVLSPTEEEFSQLRAQSLELGRTTQFSAVQAGNSQESLARAGFNTKQIIGILPSVLNTAAADGMEIAQAADIIGGAMRGFNLHDDSHDTDKEARRIGDILAYVSANSATNVAMAGAAMQGISGTAYTQKISPEQIGAYIGVLANRANLQGQEAATTLERSISALAVNKGDTSKALSKYGITTRTQNGGMRRLELIVNELYDKTVKAGSAEQQAAFMRVFGTAYGGDMLKFATGIKAGELDKFNAGIIAESGGSSAKMASVRNDTLKGDIVSLSSAWEGFMESIGNPLQEWSREIVQGITNALNALTSFIKEHEKLSEWVIKIGAGFAAWKIGSTVFKYGALIAKLPGAWLEVQRATQLASGALQGFSLVQKASTAAQWLWNAAMAANPIGLIIAAFAAVVAVCVAVYKNWDKIKAFWDSWVIPNIWEPVKEFFIGAYTFIRDKWNSFVDWFTSLELPDIFGGLWEACNKAIESVKTMWQDFMNWLGSFNPFSNWTAPSAETLQRQEQAMRNSSQGRAAQTIADNFARQYAPKAKNATGGIYDRPIWTWAAEDGAEAIIPLTDKSRGIPLLEQAMNILGVAPSVSVSAPDFPAMSMKQSPAMTQNYSTMSPNITINVSGSGDSDIADKIRQAVIDALDEISSYRERVSYA